MRHPRCHPDAAAERAQGEGACVWYGYNQGCSASVLAAHARVMPSMTPAQTVLVWNPRTVIQLMEKPIIDLCCLFQRHFNRGRAIIGLLYMPTSVAKTQIASLRGTYSSRSPRKEQFSTKICQMKGQNF
ncbi:hypothetical protein E1301_Tti011255 [Triplophysa tibetana]|uniref:Uncharacterized protein n=1 Tax=Triplophysa tibetana TaxID=1572043 RepID=A0A5A9N121_9TELE|nr:hypothetical protein E1301_Tti011255 [Triplophysa tibetana]